MQGAGLLVVLRVGNQFFHIQRTGFRVAEVVILAPFHFQRHFEDHLQIEHAKRTAGIEVVGAGGQFQPAVGTGLETKKLRGIQEEHRRLHFFVAPTGNRTVDIDHGITRIQRIHGFEGLALGGMDKSTGG